jgi:hypothetical protein
MSLDEIEKEISSKLTDYFIQGVRKTFLKSKVKQVYGI